VENSYNPLGFEQKIYEKWEDAGLFTAQAIPAKDRKSFLITMPPPNVTGVLHMGHALFVSIQDTYTRWKRMRGYNMLWLPGIDHAGIATQVMVERQVESEGTSRLKLGREKFLERVWEWKTEHGGTIMEQLRAMGSSCDWTRELFTMDKKSSRAVRESFMRFYHEGLIYRGERIVNWSSGLQTAISDLEVEQKTVQGALYYLKYMLADGSGDFITVATTRPETIFADVAVAVNPDDQRMQKFHGKEVLVPIINRKIPIILDTYVDIAFGTGALKITPGHDTNDWQIGHRHKLKTLSCIGKDGKLNELAGSFAGQMALHARKKVAEELRNLSLLEKEEKHTHELGHCQRTGVVVEPLVSMQWFVKMESMATMSLQAAQGDDPALKFYPDFWKKTYFEWLTNIQDWCISRQLWWGHQIPAWHCTSCQGIVVPKHCDDVDPSICTHCGKNTIEQDPDVLDTWYSSGLWPISTLGWPDKTPELSTFYPQLKFDQARGNHEAQALMETGSDILFFWVARMMMMCTHLMDGRIPFEDVFLHAMVRDDKGQKMSKTKGNVIDPLDISSKHGADALRLTLIALSGTGRNVNLDLKRLEGYSSFINKLWNASRFALSQIEKNTATATVGQMHFADAWILDRLRHTVDEVNKHLEEYRADVAFQAIYQFAWYEFCDWYLEIFKMSRGTSPQTLQTVLQTLLQLFHPFAPFVTEKIYSELPWYKQDSLVTHAFPAADDFECASATSLQKISAIQEIVAGVRNFRTENKINPKVSIPAFYAAKNEALWNDTEEYILFLAKLGPLTKGQAPASARTGLVSTNEFTLVIPLENLVDSGAEKTRLESELKKARDDLGFVEKRLNNRSFVENAKPELIEKERARMKEFSEKLQALEAALKQLKN
jgi:valyl-tRNA synthetase